MDDVKQIPAFIWKLYNMVEDPASGHVISWTPAGTSFVVASPMEFQEVILPKFFKHSNFSSFVRQLNLYGFHKVGEPHFWEFQHENFVRGQKNNLKLIKRRAGGGSEKVTAAVHEEISTLSKDKEQLYNELRQLQQSHQAVTDRVAKLSEQYDIVWKQLTTAHAQYQEMQNRMRRVGQMLVQMFMPEEDVMGKRKRLTNEPLRRQSLQDLHRASLPSFDFTRPSTSNLNLQQLSDRSLMGLLARKSVTNMRHMSLSEMRVQYHASMSELSGLDPLPPISNGNAETDEDFEQWMKELQESGVVDAEGNPINVLYPSQPGSGTVSAGGVIPADRKRGREDIPGMPDLPPPSRLRSAAGSQVQLDVGNLRRPSGSVASLSGLLAAAGVTAPSTTTNSATVTTTTATTTSTTLAPTDTAASTLPASQQSFVIPPAAKDMLKQLAADLRAEADRPAEPIPMVSPGHLHVINTVTVEQRTEVTTTMHTRSSSANQSTGFERVHALTNELISEVSRVCTQQGLQETLAQVSAATSIGVWVARRALDPHDPQYNTSNPREPAAILLFK